MKKFFKGIYNGMVYRLEIETKEFLVWNKRNSMWETAKCKFDCGFGFEEISKNRASALVNTRA